MGYIFLSFTRAALWPHGDGACSQNLLLFSPHPKQPFLRGKPSYVFPYSFSSPVYHANCPLGRARTSQSPVDRLLFALCRRSSAFFSSLRRLHYLNHNEPTYSVARNRLSWWLLIRRGGKAKPLPLLRQPLPCLVRLQPLFFAFLLRIIPPHNLGKSIPLCLRGSGTSETSASFHFEPNPFLLFLHVVCMCRCDLTYFQSLFLITRFFWPIGVLD